MPSMWKKGEVGMSDMPDKEKVIKGLELCLKSIDEPDCRKECPYYEACQKYEGRVIFQPLMRDTLALLKELEAVEPVTQSSVYDPDTWFYVCGSCKKGVIDRGDKYCRQCGRKVKWK